MNETLKKGFWLAITMSAMISASNSDAIEISNKHVEVIRAIVRAADVAEVPRELMLAICWNESSFRTSHMHRMDGNSMSYGICQVKLETARWVDGIYKHKYKATAKRLRNIEVNAFYASKVLKTQLKRYKGNWKRAIDAYNKGHAVSSKSVYVKRVMKHYKTIDSKAIDLITQVGNNL